MVPPTNWTALTLTSAVPKTIPNIFPTKAPRRFGFKIRRNISLFEFERTLRSMKVPSHSSFGCYGVLNPKCCRVHPRQVSNHGPRSSRLPCRLPHLVPSHSSFQHGNAERLPSNSQVFIRLHTFLNARPSPPPWISRLYEMGRNGSYSCSEPTLNC